MTWCLNFASHLGKQIQTGNNSQRCLRHFFSPQGAVISQLEFSEQGSFFQETWKTVAEPSKHHPLCNCVNKIINDWVIKRAPMTVGPLGCRRTCAHRRVWLRACVTEDFWKDSTSGGGRATACVRSKTPTANSNACLVYGNQDTTGFRLSF